MLLNKSTLGKYRINKMEIKVPLKKLFVQAPLFFLEGLSTPNILLQPDWSALGITTSTHSLLLPPSTFLGIELVFP